MITPWSQINVPGVPEKSTHLMWFLEHKHKQGTSYWNHPFTTQLLLLNHWNLTPNRSNNSSYLQHQMGSSLTHSSPSRLAVWVAQLQVWLRQPYLSLRLEGFRIALCHGPSCVNYSQAKTRGTPEIWFSITLTWSVSLRHFGKQTLSVSRMAVWLMLWLPSAPFMWFWLLNGH